MRTLAASSLPSEHRAAIAITEPRPGQRHLGIAYRVAAGSEPRLLHLAWHRALRDDEHVGGRYRCVLLADVPPAMQPVIVAQCKRSSEADSEDGLPYGFGYTPSSVHRDESTGRLLIEGASGLTCATFVLALLEVSGVRLADLDSWQDRDGDDAWKEWVAEALQQSGASEAHVAAVRNDSGHVRVRPEDVAGAATAGPLPVGFAVAISRGAEILTELQPPVAQ